MFCDNCLQGCKLSIYAQSYDPKSPLSIVDIHIIECGIYCLIFPIRKMLYHGKADFSAKGREEWYCVHKEYVCCHDDIPVKFHLTFGTWMRSSVTGVVLFLVVFSFRANVYFPHMAMKKSLSCNVTGHSFI